MAMQTKTDSSGNEYTEVWVGQPGAQTLGATINTTGITGTIVPSDPLASTTSAQAPLIIAGNADAQVTARTGGSVKAPDVATGGAGNVNGADLIVRPGKGTGTGTPGNLLLQAAPVAGAGDNPQVPATVATISSSGVTTATIIGGSAVGSDLTLQSTSGVGDGTDTVLIKVGNNGATTAGTFNATGLVAAKITGGSAVGSDLTLQSTSGVGDGTDTVLVKVGNNGATTAATFTAAGQTFGTSATVPIVVGGTAVGSDLTLQSTTGVGDGTDTVIIKVGNAGATTSATFNTTGMVSAQVTGGSAVGSDLVLQSTSGVGDGTDQVLVKVGNNGATTAATFDAAGQTLGTSVTVPSVIGGTAVGADLVLQSTSGVGDGTDQVLVKVGNAGGTTVATFDAAGQTLGTQVTVPKVIGGSAVGSDLTLQSTSGVGDGTDTIVAKCGNAGGTTIATFASTGLNVALPLSTSDDAITSTSEGVAASLTTVATEITTNGDVDLDNVTLADGSIDGQIKIFSVVAVGNAGDSVKITPAKFVGGTQITFAASPLGLGCIMRWSAAADKWAVVANNGGTIA